MKDCQVTGAGLQMHVVDPSFILASLTASHRDVLRCREGLECFAYGQEGQHCYRLHCTKPAHFFSIICVCKSCLEEVLGKELEVMETS